MATETGICWIALIIKDWLLVPTLFLFPFDATLGDAATANALALHPVMPTTLQFGCTKFNCR